MGHIFGMLRVKNEDRWLGRVLDAIKPVCERIFVMDDHSTDGTADICNDRKVDYLLSPFDGLDESRDKDWLLSILYAQIAEDDKHWTNGNPKSPYWALTIDGDEELMPGGASAIEYATSADNVYSYHLRVPYLWNTPKQIRVDRVYRRFEQLGRPSLFRLMNHDFRFLKTPFGRSKDGKPVNFHCSSIPQELLYCAQPCKARLLHWGYLNAEDRMRKYLWYNEIDPNNAAEDCYRHMVIGDLFPADSVFRWGGPLELETLKVHE